MVSLSLNLSRFIDKKVDYADNFLHNFYEKYKLSNNLTI